MTKKTTLSIEGMHCPSCDILVKDKLSQCKNIKSVQANHRTQQAEIEYTGELNEQILNESIAEFGYSIRNNTDNITEPLTKRIMDAVIIGVIIIILAIIAQELKLIPDMSGFSQLTYSAALLMGLIASTSTCMATSGALFLVTIGKLHRSDASRWEQLGPALTFNAGRVFMYALGGYGLGWIGKTVSFSPQANSILSLFVAIFMILIALDMLKLFSLSSFIPRSLSAGIFEKLKAHFSKNPRRTAFFLGASTYWLPCGFTQTVQVYALSLADPLKGAILMALFAIGTVPALMAIGFFSAFTKRSFYPWLAKVMGVLILLFGLYYLSNTLNLYGIKMPWSASVKQSNQQAVPIQEGFQIVRMSVNAQGYSPNHIVIRKDIPVKWIINGENTFGCQANLIAPAINFQTIVKAGENIYEFTPKQLGTINFSCSMGMYNGAFEVVEG